MRHEGSKAGLYEDIKRYQLGNKKYEAMKKRAYSIMKRDQAILDCMEYLAIQKDLSEMIYTGDQNASG